MVPCSAGLPPVAATELLSEDTMRPFTPAMRTNNADSSASFTLVAASS
jgi:hypothetical protein